MGFYVAHKNNNNRNIGSRIAWKRWSILQFIAAALIFTLDAQCTQHNLFIYNKVWQMKRKYIKLDKQKINKWIDDIANR